MKKNALVGILVLLNLALLTIAAAPKKPSVLTVSEINVVDAKGVVRARIAGNLPETYSNGKPVGRGAAGVLIYDASGKERGGYVTFANDHAALTLDSKKEMTVMLVAGPTAGAALVLKDRGTLIDVRVDPDNGPTFHAIQDKKVVYHQPPAVNFEKGPDCAEMRGGLTHASRADMLDVCRQRMSEEACQACLGQ
jgi:hypothetical protein